MKKLLFTLLLTACSTTPNPAEVMIKAQAPEAKCVDYGTHDGISLVRCQVKDQTFVGAYSIAHPFAVWPLPTADQVKAAQAQRQAPAPTLAPPAGPVDAGVDGEGAGSHAR